jgi:hypothetical protein
MALLGTSRTSGGRKKSLVSQLIINEFVFLKIFKIFKTITLEIKKFILFQSNFKTTFKTVLYKIKDFFKKKNIKC